MVKVEVCKKADYISRITITGHANSAEYGQDLVCAGVSSIAVGILNTLDELCTNMCILEMNDAHIYIEVKTDDKTVQTILKTLYIQLKTMTESYKEYIEIMKVEV
ncbi:uncharacterized protein YsxB (DUF464 family) [Breznakia sp. PF5-3]|uniref:ribosomal-processing cysteine protease Prp n=1 Tax=unclassified Breznakia TaxID=2623764 RepID=UPI0024068628|nr:MULTISPECIES: ribosomal-processing cysteine protease Prp [unclassified Breznakia]MDL2276130.1 ribosomal-processing cysteine protease Prp [Breznakia sp. OttesenSCG-928-G09]MDF9824422.1 uncharacterized protein YsxB (DUF464 family) [Breznakia sp. PM6-1]MDF9835151.1 uncharacterized protein YsxB (DUF464 family) [Breznakia sp. PF5-3]MDF9838324.1 uncharacterized protein YsxB (DUF464 family) [Breznakia sp. PFB2-8]MDF9860340.1 uncharacterized protein YsxB (DUF464 family) [Breznakia sp. PH5-24]